MAQHIGKTGAGLTAFLDAGRDAQPILELCANCDWRFEGSASDARDAFAEHVLVHPSVNGARGRKARAHAQAVLKAKRRARAERDAA